MPDPIAVAQVDIRAKLDDFERDLSAVQAKLQALSQQLDKSTESTRKFGDSTEQATTKVNAFKDSLTSLKDFTLSAFSDAMKNLASSTAGYFEPLLRWIDDAREKTEQFQKVIASAAALGISTDMFQRMSASAEKFRLTAGQAADTFQRFAQATKEEFGGSLFDRTLLNLQQAGNFLGNAGVQAYRAASSVEERYKAVANIINTAMQSGERLAAIKLAESFMPGDVLQRLREGNQFLAEWAQKADAVSQTQIVSTQQLAEAAELKRRMDDVIKAWSKAPEATESWRTASLGLYRVWVNIAELGTKLSSSAWWKSIFARDKPVSIFPEQEIRAYTELVQKMSVGGAIGPGTGGAPIPYAGEGPLQAGFASPTNQQLLEHYISATNIGINLQREAVKKLKEAYGELTSGTFNPFNFYAKQEEILGTNIKMYQNYNNVVQNSADLAKTADEFYKKFHQSDEERLGMIKKETDGMEGRNEVLEAWLAFRERAAKQDEKDIFGFGGGSKFGPTAGTFSRLGFGAQPALPGISSAFGVALTQQTKDQQRETMLVAIATKQYEDAINRLAVGMSDYNNIALARIETERSLKDQSKEMEGLFTSQAERIARTTALEQARAQAVGKGAFEEGKLRAELGMREVMEVAAIRDQKVFIDTLTLSVDKQNEMRAAAVSSGKMVVQYSDMQKAAVQSLAKAAGDAAQSFESLSNQQKINIETQSLALNLTRNEREVYGALIREFGSLEAARKSEKAQIMLGNLAIAQSAEVTRDRAVVSRRYSQEEIDIANRLRKQWGDTYKDIDTALKSTDADRLKATNTEKLMIQLEREHSIVAHKLSADERAVVESLKGRFAPDAAGAAAALRSPEGQQKLQTMQLERLNDLRRETQIITRGVSDDEAAILTTLKAQTMDLDKAGKSEAAREMRLQNQLKLERDLNRELKLSVGYTDEEQQIADKLFHKYRDVNDALKSSEANILRVAMRLKEAQTIAADTATQLYSGFVGNLRQGMTAVDAWKQAATNAVRSVVDKLAEMAIKFAVVKATGALLGGTGAKELVASVTAASTELTTAGSTAGGAVSAGGTEGAAALEGAGATVSGALISGATEASVELEGVGTVVAGSLNAGALTAATELEAAGATVSGALIAGATEAATILASVQGAAMLGLRQGGVVGLPRFQQGGIPGDPDAVPLIAHRGEEVIRRDDPRHSLNRGMGAVNGGGGHTINISFTANGRMTSNDIKEHAMTIAKQVATVFNQNPAMRRASNF